MPGTRLPTLIAVVPLSITDRQVAASRRSPVVAACRGTTGVAATLGRRQATERLRRNLSRCRPAPGKRSDFRPSVAVMPVIVDGRDSTLRSRAAAPHATMGLLREPVARMRAEVDRACRSTAQDQHLPGNTGWPRAGEKLSAFVKVPSNCRTSSLPPSSLASTASTLLFGPCMRPVEAVQPRAGWAIIQRSSTSRPCCRDR